MKTWIYFTVENLYEFDGSVPMRENIVRRYP